MSKELAKRLRAAEADAARAWDAHAAECERGIVKENRLFEVCKAVGYDPDDDFDGLLERLRYLASLDDAAESGQTAPEEGSQ